jgi:hypothetical protein
MKEKITHEVQRIKKFYSMMLDEKAQIYIKKIDVRDYGKFILQEGSIEEKREFLGCLKSKVILSSKTVKIH